MTSTAMSRLRLNSRKPQAAWGYPASACNDGCLVCASLPDTDAADWCFLGLKRSEQPKVWRRVERFWLTLDGGGAIPPSLLSSPSSIRSTKFETKRLAVIIVDNLKDVASILDNMKSLPISHFLFTWNWKPSISA